VRKLIKLIDSPDERVALMASDKILERAWGKPKEMSDSGPLSLANLPPEAQKRRVLELLAFAATLTAPAETIEQPPEATSQEISENGE